MPFPSGTARTSPPGLTALVVDDDPAPLALLEAILQDLGIAVRTSQNPREALRMIEGGPPDLLVTDLRMPELSGFDLLRAARRLDPELCTLVVTGFASAEAVSEAFRAGAQDLILKPLNVEEVRARVTRAAEMVHLRRQVRALRAADGCRRDVPEEESARGPARARELTELSAVPGAAGPPEAALRRDLAHALECLAALHRAGVLSAAEVQHKRRELLSRR